MVKYLVFGGDSFVEPIGITWPTHVLKDGRFREGLNVALGGMSNKYIRMSVIWSVKKLISEGINTDDLVVMVSWSGPSRNLLYTDMYDAHLAKRFGGFKIKTDFTDSASSKGFTYMPLCSAWDSPTNDLYYKHIEVENNSIIDSLHDILFLQEFLTKRGIKYLMTTSWNIIDTTYDTWTTDLNEPTDTSIATCEKLNLPEFKWICDLIDWDKFIPVKGQWEWTNKMFKGRESHPDSHHPLDHEHELFTNQMIIPHYNKLYGK